MASSVARPQLILTAMGESISPWRSTGMSLGCIIMPALLPACGFGWQECLETKTAWEPGCASVTVHGGARLVRFMPAQATGRKTARCRFSRGGVTACRSGGLVARSPKLASRMEGASFGSTPRALLRVSNRFTALSRVAGLGRYYAVLGLIQPVIM